MNSLSGILYLIASSLGKLQIKLLQNSLRNSYQQYSHFYNGNFKSDYCTFCNKLLYFVAQSDAHCSSSHLYYFFYDDQVLSLTFYKFLNKRIYIMVITPLANTCSLFWLHNSDQKSNCRFRLGSNHNSKFTSNYPLVFS